MTELRVSTGKKRAERLDNARQTEMTESVKQQEEEKEKSRLKSERLKQTHPESGAVTAQATV